MRRFPASLRVSAPEAAPYPGAKARPAALRLSGALGLLAMAVPLFWLATPAVAQGTATPAVAQEAATCASLTSVRLPQARVVDAALVEVDGKQVCRVSVASTPTARSDIRFELWVPLGAAWNERYVQLGHGGLAGSVLTGPLRTTAARGYATANTDGGHRADSMEWARDPVRWADLSWRAQKVTYDNSKRLIIALKGRAARQAYFVGCSEGGREALMAAQRFPDDFDGIVAGAPANDWGRLAVFWANTQRALLQPGGHLGPEQLELLQRSVLGTAADTGWLRDPLRASFDPASLACKDGPEADCLTAPQLASARALYDGLRFGDGPVVFPGYTGGSETFSGNWGYVVAPSPEGQRRTFAYMSASVMFDYLANPGAKTDLAGVSDADLRAAVKRAGPIMDATDPDLSRFRASGGKLIQWHGWADAAIPARSSIRYQDAVARKLGRTDDFYRLYMVPGMLHCRPGPAPCDVDWLGVLDEWVSEGHAPGHLTANYGPDQPQTPGVARQTLCPYPSRLDNAGSCVPAPPRDRGR